MTMSNKVLPSKKVSIPVGPMDSSRAVTNRAPPAVPPSHRQSGSDNQGNGTGAYAPLKK